MRIPTTRGSGWLTTIGSIATSGARTSTGDQAAAAITAAITSAVVVVVADPTDSRRDRADPSAR